MRRLCVLLAMTVAFTIAACASHTYAGQGLILRIDQSHNTVELSCKEIPNFMQPKRASFRIAKGDELSGLHVGDMVDFNLVVDGSSSQIESVRLHKYESVERDPLAARRLNIIEGVHNPNAQVKDIEQGDKVEDFSLIDEMRQPVRLSEFHGKVVAINFVYTHCLLPNYCFRMSDNFRRLQKRLASDLGRNLVLLTITFDPEHDTPDVLKQYAKTWNANPANWHFLTGPPAEVTKVCRRFGMAFFPDEGLMTHSLHTVVIDRQGKLVTNLEGNQFTADQLGDLVETVMERNQ
jgi:protein SCO1/2